MLKIFCLLVVTISFITFDITSSVESKTISTNTSTHNIQEQSNLNKQNQTTQVVGQVAENGLLEMISQGDYIGAGKTYYLSEGVFTAQLGLNKQGKPDTITLKYYPFGSISEQWSVSLSSRMLGKPLVKSKYPKAVRYPFETFGLAGLSVFGESRGCNELTGSFTIKQLKINYNGQTPKLERLTVSFSQFCEGRKPALKGTFYFNTVPNRVLP